MPLPSPQAFLLDLDGTVYVDESVIPGVPDAVAALRRAGHAVRFITNTTRTPPSVIAARLNRMGIPVAEVDVVTPVGAARRLLAERGVQSIAAFLPESAAVHLGVRTVTERPEAIVVGDLGAAWDFDVLNRAFRHLMDGAEFIALHRNRYWLEGGERTLDAGPFVVALEYATGRSATLCGKPAEAFFASALAGIDVPRERVAMIGDDLESDVAGAQCVGMQGWLVETGKTTRADLVEATTRPDRVLRSLAELASASSPG